LAQSARGLAHFTSHNGPEISQNELVATRLQNIQMKSKWTADQIPSQAGRRVIITGANSGIGFHTALELARRGAEIVIPARSESKAQSAMTRIQLEVPDAKLLPEILDLADLSSVRAFTERIADYSPGRSIDLLINNAAVMAIPTRELTVDGFERQFATNYLGPFALTALLFPHLKGSRGTRIVTVASTAANYGKVDFANLQSKRAYGRMPMYGAYSQSKLADLIFAFELQRRLAELKSPIVSTAAHPGAALTNLQSNFQLNQTGFVMRVVGARLARWFSHDASCAALPTLFAATSSDAMPGGYYGPDGFQELKGDTAPAKIPAAAKDFELGRRLWSETERLVGMRFTLT
jgi:NAD(P)-dependent dehydrogenase (short-subunit alcohol dehydrogenase family)